MSESHTTKRIAHIVVPDGYESAEEFAADCGFMLVSALVPISKEEFDKLPPQRQALYWTQEALDECKREAEKLAKYFAENPNA